MDRRANLVPARFHPRQKKNYLLADGRMLTEALTVIESMSGGCGPAEDSCKSTSEWPRHCRKRCQVRIRRQCRYG
jgi:hypothetical protein